MTTPYSIPAFDVDFTLPLMNAIGLINARHGRGKVTSLSHVTGASHGVAHRHIPVNSHTMSPVRSIKFNVFKTKRGDIKVRALGHTLTLEYA